jgi:hypothetical protein
MSRDISVKAASRIHHIIEAMAALALTKLEASIYSKSIWDESLQNSVWTALEHVEQVALDDVVCQHHLVPFNDPVLRRYYECEIQILNSRGENGWGPKPNQKHLTNVVGDSLVYKRFPSAFDDGVLSSSWYYHAAK